MDYAEMNKALKEAIEKCGGPGSGVPGPCPSGKKPPGRRRRGRKPQAPPKKPRQSHEDELKERQAVAGKVGGKVKEVEIGGKKVKSMTLFHKPDLTIGGSRTSRSVLLGDHTTYNGKSGNVRQIDPAGKHLILQSKSGYSKVPIRKPEQDWADLEST
jgi:hypothetical protein